MKTSYGLPTLREKVLEVLKDAFLNNHIEEQEYESRLKQALNAQYVEDLRLVLYDFPKNIKDKIFEENTPKNSPIAPNLSPILPTETVFRSILSGDNSEIAHIGDSISFSAILGEQKANLRKSSFSASQIHLDALSYLGSITLDLRNEDLEGKHFDIYVDNILGSIKILIPAACRIDNQLNNVMGDFSIKNTKKSWFKSFFKQTEGLTQEANFSITIYGKCILGEVTIEY
jgi:hypothetical protein